MSGINKSINYPDECKFRDKESNECGFIFDQIGHGGYCDENNQQSCDVLLAFQSFYISGFKDGQGSNKAKNDMIDDYFKWKDQDA